MCAGWTSKLIPASRRSSWRRGEAEARISLGLASILSMCESVSRYVKEQTLSKVSSGMLGASLAPEGCEFRVWAPNARQVKLRLISQGGEATIKDLGSDGPGERDRVIGTHTVASMDRMDDEYFVVQIAAHPGDKYFY